MQKSTGVEKAFQESSLVQTRTQR